MKPEEKIARWIVTRHPVVQAIWVYGSRARGNHRQRSDVDLAVKMKPDAAKTDFLNLKQDVEENSPTLLEIDLVDYDKVSADLKARIEKDKVQLYEK